MAYQIPNIGRNGIVNLCRKVSGSVVTGYRDIDSSAQFVMGQVAKLASVGGQSVVQVCTNSASDKPIGIFMSNKTLNFYVPVVSESQTFGDTASGNTATTVTLNHANLKGAAGTYVKVTNSLGTVVYTYGNDGANGDYTVNYTNGIVTRTTGGTSHLIGATDTVLITYYYEAPNVSGIDNTMGSGKVAVMEDFGEVATRVYDTNATWELSGNNSIVVSGSDGIPTTKTKEATAPVIGQVTKVPSSGDVELYFKLKFA